MAQRGGRGRRLSSSADEAEQPDEALARILRTEAAVSGVSRKAAATSGQQSTCLWPRAVLEALDYAVASCHWESALEVRSPSPLTPTPSRAHHLFDLLIDAYRVAISPRSSSSCGSSGGTSPSRRPTPDCW
jgi:hypothetical protein